MKRILLAVCLLAGIFPLITLAHPGRTASDGCHYCRTNCAKWGVPQGERHCHFYSEPTKEIINSSVKVKEYSDENVSFVTFQHDNTWLTYQTKTVVLQDSKL
ncbi:YHYH domain-containing protein [Vibrio sp. 99-8-1]|uniref:YHYH domain-containing protein n=1 Tax=Vibrio sp. 99-8-1 TaxID=2607602 RepID=UPI001493ADDD|nr:YHYH domain-containing protein [Vibrio sp. 99-8-1]NOI67909.1 YHYH domain-containing protein [Vibrio sp. 99-8-1]